jgi:hypothetical protein
MQRPHTCRLSSCRLASAPGPPQLGGSLPCSDRFCGAGPGEGEGDWGIAGGAAPAQEALPAGAARRAAARGPPITCNRSCCSTGKALLRPQLSGSWPVTAGLYERSARARGRAGKRVDGGRRPLVGRRGGGKRVGRKAGLCAAARAPRLRSCGKALGRPHSTGSVPLKALPEMNRLRRLGSEAEPPHVLGSGPVSPLSKAENHLRPGRARGSARGTRSKPVKPVKP